MKQEDEVRCDNEEPCHEEYGSCYFCKRALERWEAAHGDVCEACFELHEMAELWYTG